MNMYIFYTMRDVCLNMYIAICKVKMIAFNAQMLQLTVNKVKKKKNSAFIMQSLALS